MKAIHLIILWVLMLFGCSNNTGEAVAEATEAASPVSEIQLDEASVKQAGIATGLATYEDFDNSLQVNGTVDVPPQSLVSISFPLGGYLKSTDLLPGRKVSKGQVLAVMEDQSYVQLQQDYLQAVSKLSLLKLEYQRQLSLREGDASSLKNFEIARNELEMQQVQVKALAEKLLILGISPQQLTVEKISRTVPVRAPISGFVKSVFVNVGKYVNPSDVLFEIVDPDHIHGSLIVFEKDQHQVKQGQKVSIFTPSNPGKIYKGEVILVSKDVDSNRGVQIHCHFLSPHADLIPGMYISANIITEKRVVPVLPEAAIVRHDGKHFVFLEKGKGAYQMKEITVGVVKEGKAAVNAEGIDWHAEKVVLSGAYALLGALMNTGEE